MNVRRLWVRLTTPPGAAQEPEQARRSHLLLSILVVLFPLAFLSMVVSFVQLAFTRDQALRQALSTVYPVAVAFDFLVMMAAYFLVRRGRYAVAAVMTSSLTLVTSFGSVVASGREEGMFFMTFSVLIAGVLLSWRATLALFVLACAAMISLPFFLPGLAPIAVSSAIIVFFGVGALSLVAASVRDRDLAQIEDQARKLRENQEALLGTRKMEAIARLSAGMAHEFNNIMTAIVGYSEVIALKPTDTAPRYARLIKDAGLRAGDLTERLLSFSRQQLLRPHSTDLNHLVARVARTRASQAQSVRVTLDLSSSAALSNVDPEQVERAVDTLIARAVVNAGQAGTVSIRTRDTDRAVSEVPTLQPGVYHLITVSDSGPPLGNDLVHRVFDPYFTTGEFGTGDLDLAAAYGIVGQSGGHVGVQSDEKGGNTFVIYLPAEAVAAPGPEVPRL
jgi:signal transduction histidine kinase